MLVNKNYIKIPEAEEILTLKAFLAEKVRKEQFKKRCLRHELHSVGHYFQICFYDYDYDITIQAWRYTYTKKIQGMKRYKNIKVINNKVGNKLIKYQILEILEHYGFCKT